MVRSLFSPSTNRRPRRALLSANLRAACTPALLGERPGQGNGAPQLQELTCKLVAMLHTSRPFLTLPVVTKGGQCMQQQSTSCQQAVLGSSVTGRPLVLVQKANVSCCSEFGCKSCRGIRSTAAPCSCEQICAPLTWGRRAVCVSADRDRRAILFSFGLGHSLSAGS